MIISSSVYINILNSHVSTGMITSFFYAQNTCVGSILCFTSILTLTRLNSLDFQSFTVVWLFLTSLESLRHFLCYCWAVCIVLALLGAFCLLLFYRVGFVPTRSLFAKVILTICIFQAYKSILSRKIRISQSARLIRVEIRRTDVFTR